MQRSPLIFSLTLAASFSLLAIGPAWSTTQPHAKASKTSSVKAKSVKAKTANAKKYRSKTSKLTPDGKAVSLKLSSLTHATKSRKFLLASAAEKINPYFANQPVAILPLAVQQLMAQQKSGPDKSPASTLPVVAPTANVEQTITAPVLAVLPAAAVVTSVTATPAHVAPASVAAIVNAPIAAVVPEQNPLPSLAPPIYGLPVVDSAQPVKVQVATYQPMRPATDRYTNPYLSYQQQFQQQFPVVDPMKMFNGFGSGLKVSLPQSLSFLPQSLPFLPQTLPFLPQTSFAAQASYAPPGLQSSTSSGTNSVSSLFSSLKMMIPLTGDANILPTIKKVYPTGEKPLVVINFKCPTELVGITPPPMKLLHEGLNLGFEQLNKTNLLSFNLQQVCS